ncbi:uncharacterized protein FA14DRAFT_172162 [Meira miltonrushii]|uniref:Uncharacterized protein n=1 Tax=Meira miltonrushii TaxID=1280837 RepID=A0A316VGU5_9BASI|nr:uncharacterized protein FA14DRAFT_172162 [Meira miltonrushii]PWN35543.1 hypothetical protein FA14DRAFT_172162 [Meira miltonrushii]
MPLMVQNPADSIPPPASPHFHSHSVFRSFTIPGTFTIAEEPEEIISSRAPSLSLSRKQSRPSEGNISKVYQDFASRDGKAPKRVRHNNMQSSELLVNYGGPPSQLDERTPTTAMIANDREANMRTPRPHTAAPASSGNTFSESAKLTSNPNTKARILQWQQRRDASDATIEPSDMRSMDEAIKSAPADTNAYATDSLGRMSTHSSIVAGGSEFGHGSRYGSESGYHHHPREVSSGSAMMRKNRKVAPPELLVVVRPPPSKQANPLNLQIQLVTPNQGGPTTGRVSGESSRDDITSSNASSLSSGTNNVNGSGGKLKSPSPPAALRRSNSVSSSRSAYSEASSAGLSTASASSTGRRVTPLYNLNFHSIMATTVNDAGTDQKVAKFNKRCVDIDGFGQLVPHELALGVNDAATMDRRRRSFTAVSASGGRADSGSGASDLNSPAEVRSDASHTRSTEVTTIHSDLDSASGSGVQMAAGMVGGAGKDIEPPTSFDAMSPQAKEANVDPLSGLGNKLLRGFKRLSVNAPVQTVTPAKSNQSIRSAATMESGRNAPSSIMARMRGAAAKVKDGDSSMFVASTDEAETLNVPEGSVAGSDSDIPQLIVGGGLKGDGTRKTQGYYWTVRRWSRRLGDNAEEDMDDLVPGRKEAGANPILNSVWKRFNIANRMGGAEVHPPASQIPVRFEWTRSEVRKRSTATTGSHHGRAATDIGTQSVSSRRGSKIQAKRASYDARAEESGEGLRLPKSNSRPSSLYGTQNSLRGSIDHGSSVSGGGEAEEDSDPEDSETKWACHLVLGPTTRIPIGSLAPTPHHPKLVAQLTVPYPLPDLSQSGLGADGAGLTREELKDIISVTALFVIIREAFGGLAKRRKGDSVIKFGAAAAHR